MTVDAMDGWMAQMQCEFTPDLRWDCKSLMATRGCAHCTDVELAEVIERMSKEELFAVFIALPPIGTRVKVFSRTNNIWLQGQVIGSNPGCVAIEFFIDKFSARKHVHCPHFHRMRRGLLGCASNGSTKASNGVAAANEVDPGVEPIVIIMALFIGLLLAIFAPIND
jgi:hypothetical protein